MGRGQQPHQISLDRVGVLVLIHHEVAIGVGQLAANRGMLPHQLDHAIEQVIVIEQSPLALISVVGGCQMKISSRLSQRWPKS